VKHIVALVVLLLVGTPLSACTSVDSQAGIYVTGADGGTATWMGAPAGVPSWSPKGMELAWASEDGLTIANMEDQTVRTIVTDPIAGKPAWSPDGNEIAYLDENSRSLDIVDVRSGAIRNTIPVATESRWATNVDLLTWGGPSWSADGKKIAFVCWDGAGDELCTADTDGSHPKQITKLGPATGATTDIAHTVTATSNIGPPAWSPAGDTVAVAAYPERSGAPSGLFLVNLQPGTARQISKLLPNSDIVWSPDGSALYFSATEKGRSDVVRIDIDDGKASKLTSALAGGARSPALSPNGERLAAINQGLVVILKDQGTFVESTPLGLKEGSPAWDASGSMLAFSAREDPLVKYD
jgi:Tol biopolymer transport system component